MREAFSRMAEVRRLLGHAVAVVSCALFLASCGKNASSDTPTSADLRAFNDASPELKQLWDGALAAAKTNGYVEAQNMLGTLLVQDLSVEQRSAALKESRTVSDKIRAAADAGDPAAKAALEQLQRPRQRPPRQ